MEIAALRMTGADRLDPVRFHFIEALARRVARAPGDVKRILDGKLREALAAYQATLRTHAGRCQGDDRAHDGARSGCRRRSAAAFRRR
jgi:hypothetical protein